METGALKSDHDDHIHHSSKRTLISSSRSKSSFRLRSPSLNSVRLRRIFDVFDKNNDSIITVDELGQALGLLGLQADLLELESMVKSHIQPGKEGLLYEDFERLHTSLNDSILQQQGATGTTLDVHDDDQSQLDDEDDESDLCEAFKVFDEDGDGYISARELQIVLGKLGLHEQGREIESVEMMISSVDLNHDGRVDFFEFKDMMRAHLDVVVVPS